MLKTLQRSISELCANPHKNETNPYQALLTTKYTKLPGHLNETWRKAWQWKTQVICNLHKNTPTNNQK
jgi:hypothetical protein